MNDDLISAQKAEILLIEQKAEQLVVSEKMFPKGGTVIVGVSGGADSTALLHFLNNHAEKWNLSLIAAHVNHGLRGENADHDEAFVKECCQKWAIPCEVLHEDVAALSKKRKEGLEACGRYVRYTFFKALAKENREAVIATAHTASDQAETVLMHLCRGAGARGLSGISPVHEQIVRPFLCLTREEIEAYCNWYHLSYCEDETNRDLDFSRNKIRQQVIPVLKTLNPKVETAVSGAAFRLREDDDCLFEMAKSSLEQAARGPGWETSNLMKQPRPVRLRALFLAAKKNGAGELSADHLLNLDLLLGQGGKITLTGGLHAEIQQGFLFFGEPKKQRFSLPLSFPKTVLPDGRQLLVRKISQKELKNDSKFHNLFFFNLLNYATISKNTVVRTRLEGDRFRPAGRGISKPLRRMMNEAHIPPYLRENSILLEREGEILWVEGLGVSESARPGFGQQSAMIIIKENGL
ncbi:tRNA lysidine(34) synthetase TilS [Caproicibacterium sp. NSD3]